MTSEAIDPNEEENTTKLADCGGENKRKEGDSASENNSEEEREDAVRDRRQQPRRERSPVVLKRGVRGTVKWFSIRNGFGFIRREDTDSDIFVHVSSIVRQTRQPMALSEDLEVEFDVVKGPKGLEAACVSGRDGKRVGNFYRFGQRIVIVRKQPLGPRGRPFRHHSDGDVLAATDAAKQERVDDEGKGQKDDKGEQSPRNKPKASHRRQQPRRFRRNAPTKNVAVTDEEKDYSASTANLEEDANDDKSKEKTAEEKDGEEDKKDGEDKVKE